MSSHCCLSQPPACVAVSGMAGRGPGIGLPWPLLSREQALQALGQNTSIGIPEAHLPGPKSASWALEPSLGTGFKSPFSRQENQGSVEERGVWSAGRSPGPRRVSVKQGWAPGGYAQGLDRTWPLLQPPRWPSRPGDEVCPIPRPGEAFKCFTCEQPTTISLCKTITHCKPEATACQTVLVQVESGESGPQWSPSPNGPQGWGAAVEVPRIGSGAHKACTSLGAPGPPKAARHAPTLPNAWREEHGQVPRPSLGVGSRGVPGSVGKGWSRCLKFGAAGEGTRQRALMPVHPRQSTPSTRAPR